MNKIVGGGNATLVQTGDLIDRGAKGREAMDLLMWLQKGAAKARGNVVPLLGNHEVMNIVGDLRYVTQQTMLPLRTESPKSGARRATTICGLGSQPRGITGSDQEAGRARRRKKNGWRNIRPAFVEYREAFGPMGNMENGCDNMRR